jgi:hypothetical protein
MVPRSAFPQDGDPAQVDARVPGQAAGSLVIVLGCLNDMAFRCEHVIADAGASRAPTWPSSIGRCGNIKYRPRLLPSHRAAGPAPGGLTVMRPGAKTTGGPQAPDGTGTTARAWRRRPNVRAYSYPGWL